MSRHLIASFLSVVALSFAPAFAGPQLVAPTDPSGKEIRDAAYSFFICISDGDAAGAKALFAGPAEHQRLLEAQLATVKAGDDLRTSLLNRFGKDDRLNSISLRPLFEKFAQGQRSSLMIVNGDDACIAGIS